MRFFFNCFKVICLKEVECAVLGVHGMIKKRTQAGRAPAAKNSHHVALALPKLASEMYPTPKPVSVKMRGSSKAALSKVSLGYDRLVASVWGLGRGVDRCQTPSKNKKSSKAMHSFKANYSALRRGMHARGQGLPRRETIEPRLAACDWNPELTFAFLGINWNGWYHFDGNASLPSVRRTN